MICHQHRGLYEGLTYGETVRVYRNLHRDVWSIQARRDGRWVVVAHAGAVSLADCRTAVSESGRQRVLDKGRKVVHAFVQGTLQRLYTPPGPYCERLSYNPYRSGSFECEGQPVTGAFAATFDLIGRAWIPAGPLH